MTPKKKKNPIIITNKLFIFHLSKPQALETRGELKGALSLSLCLLLHHSESLCDAACGISQCCLDLKTVKTLSLFLSLIKKLKTCSELKQVLNFFTKIVDSEGYPVANFP